MMEQQPFANRIDFSDLKKSVDQIREQIGKVIVGQREMIDLLIAAILADGHVIIEGVPGVAKTMTAKLLARTVAADFSRIQFTPDLMPSDVLGTSVFNMKDSQFQFKKGPIFSNLVLIDEINRAPAKTQSALFEVMEERQVTIDGHTHIMDKPFLVLATQNPIDQEGTYRLPEAQLDRFLFKIEVSYPSQEEEVTLLSRFHANNGLANPDNISAVLSKTQIEDYRKKVREVHLEDKLIHYIAQIVVNTRNNGALYLGASPRASLSIMHSSKAIAAMNGRDFVTPEDIRIVVPFVLRHRIMLTPEKEMEGIQTDQVINEIIQKIEVPR